MTSVRRLDELWFKAPGFLRGEKKEFSRSCYPRIHPWGILTPDF